MILYEQDYIMRIIHEMIRTLLKLLFNIDSLETQSALFESKAVQSQYDDLLKMVDRQEINEAENRLFKILETKNKEHFKLALLFYDYLNGFSNHYLTEANYSRDEIEQGVQTVTRMYEYDDLINMFLSRSDE